MRDLPRDLLAIFCASTCSTLMPHRTEAPAPPSEAQAPRHAARRRAAFITAAALTGLTAAGAGAQGVVTLYGGTRSGGEFYDEQRADQVVKLGSSGAVSASLDWNLVDGRQAQFFVSFQRSALPGSVAQRSSEIPVNVAYVHVGGRVFFDGPAVVSGPYVVGGLGITHLSPSLDGLSAEVRPSANLGLGVEWPLTPQLAVRAEMRSYITLVNSSGGFFCSGGCVVAIRGDTMTQFEGMLGLSFAFK